MKWFTRDYISGALDDEECERRNLEYAQLLASANLRDGAEELASLNLHDAQVQSWGVEADGRFRLRILAGDLQRGYEWLTLLYDRAELTGATMEDLQVLRLDQRGVELLASELDVSDEPLYEHRVLVWPSGEFGIRFRTLAVAREPAQPSERR